MSHVVVCILDPDFAGDLWALSREAHVWIVASVQNRRAASAVWSRENGPYSTLQGVSTFVGRDDDASTLVTVLGLIDDHHDIYAREGQWNTIRVQGLSLNNVEAQQVHRTLDVPVTLFEEPGGFCIQRL